MHPHLLRCRADLDAVIRDLSPSQAESPTSREGAWSIAGILEHLDLAYSLNAAGIGRLLEQGTPHPGRPTARQRIGRLVVVTLGHFPAGRQAPDTVRPRGRRFAETAAVIGPHLMVLDQRLLEAADRFGARRPILNHPILGPFSVSDWRRFHWVHTRHHIRQIWGDILRL